PRLVAHGHRVFFFLLLPPPSRSTLFPYTTLFRSWIARRLGAPVTILFVHVGKGEPASWAQSHLDRGVATLKALEVQMRLRPARRSEEHTSELQSLTNLVCRLLLEKKKTNTTRLNP